MEQVSTSLKSSTIGQFIQFSCQEFCIQVRHQMYHGHGRQLSDIDLFLNCFKKQIQNDIVHTLPTFTDVKMTSDRLIWLACIQNCEVPAVRCLEFQVIGVVYGECISTLCTDIGSQTDCRSHYYFIYSLTCSKIEVARFQVHI